MLNQEKESSTIRGEELMDIATKEIPSIEMSPVEHVDEKDDKS